MTLKMGSRSPKYNQFFRMSQQCSCAFGQNPPIPSGHRVLTIVPGKLFSNNLSLSLTLKMGSRSSKSNHFFSMSQQYRCTSLVKIHTFIQETGCRQAISNNLSPHVTLKMGSRPPKSNQFFYMSKQYKCASLVKIHSFLQGIGCRKAIFQPS